MPRILRNDILKKFHDMIRRKQPIIGGGAGTGLSAKCEEAGGIDLIVIYNSGRYRMAGRGSLAGMMAYGNANEIVVEMAREVLPVVRSTPVLAGVNGTDPFMIVDHFLRQLADLGFSGVQNFDLIVCHMGLTAGGAIGAETALKLADCVPHINEWAVAAKRLRKDVIVLCHGGPIAMPADAAYIMNSCPECHGFYGASSMERLPTERAIAEQTQAFKRIVRQGKTVRSVRNKGDRVADSMRHSRETAT